MSNENSVKGSSPQGILPWQVPDKINGRRIVYASRMLTLRAGLGDRNAQQIIKDRRSRMTDTRNQIYAKYGPQVGGEIFEQFVGLKGRKAVKGWRHIDITWKNENGRLASERVSFMNGGLIDPNYGGRDWNNFVKKYKAAKNWEVNGSETVAKLVDHLISENIPAKDLETRAERYLDSLRNDGVEPEGSSSWVAAVEHGFKARGMQLDETPPYRLAAQFQRQARLANVGPASPVEEWQRFEDGFFVGERRKQELRQLHAEGELFPHAGGAVWSLATLEGMVDWVVRLVFAPGEGFPLDDALESKSAIDNLRNCSAKEIAQAWQGPNLDLDELYNRIAARRKSQGTAATTPEDDYVGGKGKEPESEEEMQIFFRVAKPPLSDKLKNLAAKQKERARQYVDRKLERDRAHRKGLEKYAVVVFGAEVAKKLMAGRSKDPASHEELQEIEAGCKQFELPELKPAKKEQLALRLRLYFNQAGVQKDSAEWDKFTYGFFTGEKRKLDLEKICPKKDRPAYLKRAIRDVDWGVHVMFGPREPEWENDEANTAFRELRAYPKEELAFFWRSFSTRVEIQEILQKLKGGNQNVPVPPKASQSKGKEHESDAASSEASGSRVQKPDNQFDLTDSDSDSSDVEVSKGKTHEAESELAEEDGGSISAIVETWGLAWDKGDVDWATQAVEQVLDWFQQYDVALDGAGQQRLQEGTVAFSMVAAQRQRHDQKERLRNIYEAIFWPKEALEHTENPGFSDAEIDALARLRELDSRTVAEAWKAAARIGDELSPASILACATRGQANDSKSLEDKYQLELEG